MKTQRTLNRRTDHGADARRSPRESHAEARAGSTLMIVIALLAMLALIGVVFYTFAAQERSNSEYFAQAAKVRPCEIPARIYFDYALRQLIVGPNKNEVQSALWGGRHSMVINMLGYDTSQYVPADVDEALNDTRSRLPFLPEAHPYTGRGINLMMDGSGNVSVDQNYNNIPDNGGGGEPDNSNWLDMNLSPTARGANILSPLSSGTLGLPQPDADYTAADHNTPFLSYDGYAIAAGGAPSRVITPSFLRPALIRNIANWWDDANTGALTLRPHPEHLDAEATNRTGNTHYLYVQSGDSDAADFAATFPFNTSQPRMGVWTGDGNNWDFDVDNDQDGVKEGIWMYLGFPIQRCPDGTSHVALYSFTVRCLDSLLDLNNHGNSPTIDNLTIDGTALGGNRFLAGSNQGIAPGEVNLQHGLHVRPPIELGAMPGSSPEMDQYIRFFGREPANRQQLSNNEYFYLTRGRAEFSGSGDTQSDVTDVYPGRYGEEQTALYNSIRTMAGASMQANQFPQPGQTGINDQGGFDPAGETPRFGHPLAYSGAGSSTYNAVSLNPSDSRFPDAFPALLGNPTPWLRYYNYNYRTLPLWGTAVGGALMDSPTGNANIDDAEEIIVDRQYLQSSDAVFSPEEAALLQMSQVALDKVGLTPRLEKLLPYSMGSHADRRETGKKFTSLTWDRKTLGYARSGNRTWEFNADSNSDGKLEFPPRFGTANPFSNEDPFRAPLRQILQVEDGRLPSAGLQQFKLNINRLLYRNTSGQSAYRELTNHPNDPGQNPLPDSTIYSQGTVPYPPTTVQEQEFWARADRQTMARDIYVLLYTLGGGNDYRDYTQPNSITGDDTVNDPMGTLGLKTRVLYDDVQLQEMAQFAVNMVDALDRDNIITQFEYDKNLGNDGTVSGWNLDDNAFDSLGDNPGAAADRGIVRGAEAQQLTFSEVLAVWAKKDDSSGTATDHAVTQWNDTQDNYFTYLELRNASPYLIDFNNGASGTSADNGAWQIECTVADTMSGTTNSRYLTIKRNQIGGGGLFSIKSIGGLNIVDRYPDPISGTDLPANIMIDHDYVDTVTPMAVHDFRIAPLNTAPVVPELDLIFPAPASTNRYELNHAVDWVANADTNPISGQKYVALLDDSNVGAPQGKIITFRLRRRLHPGRATPTNAGASYNNDNPWIVVDETSIQFNGGMEPLSIDSSDNNGADFLANPGANFNDVRSRERPQALDRDPLQIGDHFIAGTAFQRNSLGGNNTRSAAVFTLLQPQFDRDFASLGELLSIPLYGPENVTRDVPRNSLNPIVTSGITPVQGTHLAAARFLEPKHASNYIDTLTGMPKVLPPSPGISNFPNEANLDLDNRWYRLLEFVEVPTRTHLQLPSLDPQANSALDVPLTPGKINPNNFRYPEVLAALLDDPTVAGDGNAYMLSGAYMDNPNTGSVHMPDRIENNARDWWEQFIYARDRLDPQTSLYLPGLPGSRPFRSYSYSPPVGEPGSTYNVNGIAGTLLRGLGSPLSNADRRRLFEVGTENDFTSAMGGGNDTTAYRNANRNNRPIEPQIRHRLLSKIAGNTTPRSHTFVVFVSVGFFEAKENSSGALRIGGRLGGAASDSVDHRGVFVVNRALIDDAYDPATGIDWNKLVEYRLTVK